MNTTSIYLVFKSLEKNSDSAFSDPGPVQAYWQSDRTFTAENIYTTFTFIGNELAKQELHPGIGFWENWPDKQSEQNPTAWSMTTSIGFTNDNTMQVFHEYSFESLSIFIGPR